MTALNFELDPADAAVIAALEAITNIEDVHLGAVADSDDSTMTVSAPLPYLVFASGLGHASSLRVGGRSGRTMPFSVSFVHGSYQGAKAIGLAVRDYLDGYRLVIDGRERMIHLDSPLSDVVVEHDQQWSRPNGSALFFGVDRFWIEA